VKKIKETELTKLFEDVINLDKEKDAFEKYLDPLIKTVPKKPVIKDIGVQWSPSHKHINVWEKNGENLESTSEAVSKLKNTIEDSKKPVDLKADLSTTRGGKAPIYSIVDGEKIEDAKIGNGETAELSVIKRLIGGSENPKKWNTHKPIELELYNSSDKKEGIKNIALISKVIENTFGYTLKSPRIYVVNDNARGSSDEGKFQNWCDSTNKVLNSKKTSFGIDSYKKADIVISSGESKTAWFPVSVKTSEFNAGGNTLATAYLTKDGYDNSLMSNRMETLTNFSYLISRISNCKPSTVRENIIKGLESYASSSKSKTFDEVNYQPRSIPQEGI
jgi:hypothetical protein